MSVVHKMRLPNGKIQVTKFDKRGNKLVSYQTPAKKKKN